MITNDIVSSINSKDDFVSYYLLKLNNKKKY